MARQNSQNQQTQQSQQQQQQENQNPPSTTGENSPPAGSVQSPSSMGLDDGPHGGPHGGLDNSGSDGPAGPQTAPPLPAAARQGDQGRPYCQRHNVLMRSVHSAEKVTHYACAVPNCDQTDKRARPTTRIPSEPMRCPNRACSSDKPKESQYLEVDTKRSTAFQLRMVCPNCGFEVKVPRPGVQAAVDRVRREAAEDLAAR